MHHSAGTQNHVGDSSWTSAALQVEKLAIWQKISRIPGIQIMVIFLVLAGWLLYLGVSKHGGVDQGAKSAMTSQQEWRQELTGSRSVAGGNGGEQSADLSSPAEFAGGSMFGAPRSGFGDASQTPSPAAGFDSQAGQSVAPGPAGQSMIPPAQQPVFPAQAGAQTESTNAMSAAPPALPPLTQPSGGRRSFSARSSLEPQDQEAALSGRNFRHRVVTER
jgi:hypothetical protein